MILRDEARLNGLVWYFTGIPCVHGHINKRYTNTSICYTCKRERNKKSRKNNPEVYREIDRRAYCKNPEIWNSRSRKWHENNPERVKKIKRKNRLKNRKKYNDSAAKRNREKRKNDPLWGLSRNLSKAIWECLKHEGGKKGKSWRHLVSFTIEELKIHLESLFKNGMTWNNYGSYWHLDHIKPLSWFNLKTEFDEAWDISNLQPLEASKNSSKCNRYIG